MRPRALWVFLGYALSGVENHNDPVCVSDPGVCINIVQTLIVNVGQLSNRRRLSIVLVKQETLSSGRVPLEESQMIIVEVFGPISLNGV
jgi:hypothetical protein